MKNILLIALITFLGVTLLLALIGYLLFPRPDLPGLVAEETCTRYGIIFDTTSIENIYLDPQNILNDPDSFLNDDTAYQILAESRAKGAAPFRSGDWLEEVERLASQTKEKRQQQNAYRLYELITSNQYSFCQEVGQNLLTYLPEETDLSVTIYLTALDEPVPAYARGQEIAFSLSHPLFESAAIFHEPTALSSFYNLALQELFHIGFSDTFKRPSLEEHMENEVVIDMLISLQNEGIATHIEHELLKQYPSPFEWFLYLIDKEPIVRWYIKEINELLAIAITKPSGDAYETIYRQIGSLCYQRKGFYIVGAYMAMTIERELGRDVLVKTIVGGYDTFADTYNELVDKEMRIDWKSQAAAWVKPSLDNCDRTANGSPLSGSWIYDVP